MKKTERVYLAGPMNGYPDFNRPAFHKTAKRLRKAGFAVVNPAELDSTTAEFTDYNDYYRRDLPYLMTCTLVVVLPGWNLSRGAVLEVAVARYLGMNVLSLPGLKPIDPNSLPSVSLPRT